jgi:AAA domain
VTKLDRRTNDLRYLRRRPGRAWELVVPVPLDLRPLFNGQTRIARSLKTDSLAEARRRRWPVREEMLKAFDAARAERRLSLPEMEAACARHYAATFETAMHWSAQVRDMTADMWTEALFGDSEARDENPDGDHLDPEAVAKEIAAVRQRSGCKIVGEDERILARGLLRAGIAGVLGADAIKNARPADAPDLPWVVELSRPGAWNGSGSTGRPIAHRGRDGSPMISEALEQYLTSRQADSRTALSGRFVGEVRTTIRRLIDHLGDISIGSVTKRDASGFIEHLIATTARSAATANKSVTSCGGLWKWAIKAGVLDEDAVNPWRGLSRPAPRADRVSWLPYEPNEIVAIWRVLVDHAPDWRSPDAHTVAAALPWMFASSLLGGLRIEEVAGLRCRDVAMVGDVLVFDVVEHERRRLRVAAVAQQLGGDCPLIVIDTYTAALGADGSDCDPKDVSAFIAAIQQHLLTTCTVLILHHFGKDSSRGGRGWSGLRAALDFELEIDQAEDGRGTHTSGSSFQRMAAFSPRGHEAQCLGSITRPRRVGAAG